MTATPPYERHAFLCTSGKVCPRQGADDLLGEFRRQLKAAGLTDRIRVNKTGCLAQCGYGPMLVVHPDNVWYAALTPADAQEIIEEHLVGGRIVERLRYENQGETGKRICPRGEEPIPPTDPATDP